MRHKLTPPLFLSLVLLLMADPGLAADGPWRLNDALDLTAGFSLTGWHRTRLEAVHNSVRSGTSENDELLTSVTVLNAEYVNGGFGAQLELLDARQELGDDDSIFGTDSLNALGILQARVNYSFGENSSSVLTLGRVAGDWGSRRLLARHRYGNTIYAFDGIQYQYRGTSGTELRLLASQPVNKFPADRASLLDNDIEHDKSSNAHRFYAAYLTLPELSDYFSTELFVYSMHETDSHDYDTRNRQINSYGVRLLKAPAVSQFHFELESIIQDGRQRASTNITDRVDQDHEAFFHYAMAGYSFDVPSNIRLIFEVDYVSGDSDPFDDDNERFDSVFGVTTFEFAPTGIYGVFSGTNVITPGIRYTSNPSDTVDLMFSYRHFWLEEDKDTWGRTGLRDKTGKTDDYLGQHFEARVRWDAIPGNVRIEMGGVLLHAKHLADTNSLFGYVAATFTF